MTHTFADYAAMFFASFFTVFLLGLQSKNVNAGRYVAAMVTAVGISLANFVFVKFAAAGSLDTLVVCAVGGAIGIASSILFYQTIIERKHRGNKS